MKKYLFLVIPILIIGLNCSKQKTCVNSCGLNKICYYQDCICDSTHQGTNCESTKASKFFGVYFGKIYYANAPAVNDTITIDSFYAINLSIKSRIYSPLASKVVTDSASATLLQLPNVDECGNIIINPIGKSITISFQGVISSKDSSYIFIGSKP